MMALAPVYGQALFELALEDGQQDRVLSELSALDAMLSETPDYVRLMDTYSLPRQERVSLLDEAFSGRISALTLNTMKLLTERNALHALPGCRKAYEKAYRTHFHIAEALIESAVPLDEASRQRIIAALEKKTAKKIEPRWKVEPALGAGLRIEIDGVRYDNSVAAQLSSLERLLLRD